MGELLIRRREMLKNSGGGGRIPSAYQEVDYVQSDGTQWIVTDVVPNNTRTQIEFQYLDYRSGKDNHMCACWGTSSQRYYVAVISSQGAFRLATKTNDQRATMARDFNWHEFDFNNASHQVLWDGVVRATDNNFALSGSTATLKIFSMGANTKYAAIGRIRYIKCTDNDSGDVVGEFIPCVRKADNIAGFYDTVAKKFYREPNEANPLIAGPSV